MILIDPPAWTAHGTQWSHLVSDASLLELRTFARAAGLPDRGFDLDHYDVQAHRHDGLVAAGATPVDGRTLARRLAASDLRVPGHERAGAKRPALRARWATLAAALSDGTSDGLSDSDARRRHPASVEPVPGEAAWERVGHELVERWGEPHRVYHGRLHLTASLDALDQLVTDDLEPRAARIARAALWFHDAVHDGAGGDDEERSAALAHDLLAPLTSTRWTRDDTDEVGRLVLLTAGHDPAPGDRLGALVSDADLAVLGGSPARYARYVHQVRAEYGHVPDDAFRAGRAAVLDHLLGLPTLFHTPQGRARWAAQATANLRQELRSHRR